MVLLTAYVSVSIVVTHTGKYCRTEQKSPFGNHRWKRFERNMDSLTSHIQYL